MNEHLDPLRIARPDDLGEAWLLARSAIEWLRSTYPSHRIYVERDLVWTLQRWLVDQAAGGTAELWVRNDHGTQPGPRRSLSTDIALLTPDSTVPLVALEFKFEPSHRRADIDPRKLPIVGWEGVVRDVERIRGWVRSGLAFAGAAVSVDEGGFAHARHPALPGCSWEHWGGYGDSALDVWVHMCLVAPPGYLEPSVLAAEAVEDRTARFTWTLKDLEVDPVDADQWALTYRSPDGAETLVQDMAGLLRHLSQAGATDLPDTIRELVRSPAARRMPDCLRAQLRMSGLLE